MAEIPMEDRAMLGNEAGPDHLDWNNTVADCVREFLGLPSKVQATCYLEAISPIVFDDDLPARKHLNPDMIESLAARMRDEGSL